MIEGPCINHGQPHARAINAADAAYVAAYAAERKWQTNRLFEYLEQKNDVA